ncbi:MAG: hypothetical protein V4527_04120 [Pseudomonadota bacterium]
MINASAQYDPYNIWIVSPPGYSHSRCFDELALGLRDAFIALGHAARIFRSAEAIPGNTIVLGANIIPGFTPPRDAIIFNLEQVSAESNWLSSGYVSLLRNHRVWDYSRNNIAALAKLGVTATLCEVGYMPGLSRIAPTSHQDIDVLFVGSLNERRELILRQMSQRGIRVVYRFDLYGEERDALFARAKIVINIHYYQAKILEIVRVSYLLANRICVVSEPGEDRSLEIPLEGAIAFSPYTELTDTCLRLLGDDGARLALRQKGFDIFAARSQVEMLKAALRAQ